MKNKTKTITTTALMAALVCLATYLIKIPSLHGYTHLGDCMIFISVLTLGTKRGAIAGGLGAALADFLGGYMIWIVPTFFIKAIMAILMGLICEKLLKNHKYGWIIGSIIGGMSQIILYTLVKFPLFGSAYAISGLVSLSFQTISGIVLSIIIVTALTKSKIISTVKEV